MSDKVLAQTDPYAADVALARDLYAQFSKPSESMRSVQTHAQRADVEYRSELKVWADDSGIRKIQASDLDDDGDVISEYYFQDENLVFVYQATHGYSEAGKLVVRSADRQYFRLTPASVKGGVGNKMFRWLAGLEKRIVGESEPDFVQQAGVRIAAAQLFMQAGTEALRRASTPGFVKIGTEYKYQFGTVTSAQSGDVACYLSLLDDSGQAFEELAEFELCEKQELIGKRVKLGYIESRVVAQSCQGDPECPDSEAAILVNLAQATPK